MRLRSEFIALLGAGFVVLAGAGCESPSWKHSLNESFNAKDGEAESSPRTEEEHRREYAETHSRKSMRWLLGHRVHAGMSYNDVCHVLGEEGERETKDRALKTTATNVRLDDEVYSFGPDSDGRSLYLFFRDDRLINFDPTDFQ
jgi:hypothetical protein